MINRTYEEFCICHAEAKELYLKYIGFEEFETNEQQLDCDKNWNLYNDKTMYGIHGVIGYTPNPWVRSAFYHYLYNEIESHIKRSLIKQAMEL